MDSSKPKEMAVPKEEALEVPKEEKAYEVPKEKEASEVPPKAKKARKKKVFADIWVVKASKQKNGDEDETLIGAYSSKEVAIENAWKTMEEFEGRQGFKDTSETIGEGGGVVFSCYGDEMFTMSIHKVSLDKPSDFYF